MGGLNGTPAIIKLVAFILACVCFGLSILIYKGSAWHYPVLAGGVFAGFFWYYILAFIGMMTGNDLDSEVSKSYAIYASIAYFGAGLCIILFYSHHSDSDGTISLICGIVAIAAAVLAFLDAYFMERG